MPRQWLLRQWEGALVTDGSGDVPDAVVHRRALVVTDDVAPLQVSLHLLPLVRDVAVEQDAVSRLRVQDHVLVPVTPVAEEVGLVAVELLSIQAGRLAEVPALDELQ